MADKNSAEDRKKKLAAQLRENLKRRKSQSRNRDDTPPTGDENTAKK
jgi:hypothetical protein